MTDRILWLDRVGSTQDVVHALGAEGRPDGTAVVAVEQMAGRGSRGREWHSPRGGLWISVLSRPSAAVPAEALSVRVALGVADVLERHGLGRVGIKWPNDLMMDDRKLGGILCEARWTGDVLAWITIGVGVNVSNPIAPELAGRAIAGSQVQPDLRASDLALPVIESVRQMAGRAGALDQAERREFIRRDWLFGRPLTAPLAGVADGIEADGSLRIRCADGRIEPARVGPAVAHSH